MIFSDIRVLICPQCNTGCIDLTRDEQEGYLRDMHMGLRTTLVNFIVILREMNYLVDFVAIRK